MSLFQLGDFQLHSGAKSKFKIECDNLDDGDIEALAWALIQKIILPFGHVIGIPRGGWRIAEAMKKYAAPNVSQILLVDDVLTTGNSMEVFRIDQPTLMGAVLFARGPCPKWITPLFQM